MSDFDPDQYLSEKQGAKAPDFNPDQYIAEKQGTDGGGILGTISKVARKIDSYTGAPVRSAIGAYQDRKNPVLAYVNEFGQNPDLSHAPTGQDIMRKAGVSESPVLDTEDDIPNDPASGAELAISPNLYRHIPRSALAGTAVDIAADPLNFIPAAGAVKKALSGTRIAESAAEIPLQIGSKLGHALSGVPEGAVRTYMQETPAVNAMIKNSGGNMPEMADSVRRGYQQSIQSARTGANDQITAALKAASPEKNIDIQPVINVMDGIKGRINPALSPEPISQIDELISRLKAAAPEGKANVSDLQDIKQFLQGRAKGSYLKDGQFFQTAGEAKQAAKSGTRQSKVMLDEVGPPELAEANAKLSQLHQLEDRMNPNLITPEKPDAALMAAGSGENGRNAAYLKKLGQVTGTDAMGPAERLSAAKYFSNPSLLPVDSTGKATTRVGLGAVAGGLLGGVTGVGVPTGAAIGGALTSPFVLKGAINAGRTAMSVGEGAANLATKGFKAEQGARTLGDLAGGLQPAFAGTQQGDQMDAGVTPDVLNLLRKRPDLIDSINNPKLREAYKAILNRQPSQSPVQKDYIHPDDAVQQFKEGRSD